MPRSVSEDFLRARAAGPFPPPGPFPPAKGTGLFSGSRSCRWRRRLRSNPSGGRGTPGFAGCPRPRRRRRPGLRCECPSAPARRIPRGRRPSIFKPVSRPGPRKDLAGRAVGLVEAGLEDVKNAQLRAGFFERRGDLQAELFIFNHARPGDQKQPARRIEIFPDGGVVEHAEVLAAKRGKVNGTWQPTPARESFLAACPHIRPMNHARSSCPAIGLAMPK